jgi:uncharacterized coiled-coil DUF342 family protein
MSSDPEFEKRINNRLDTIIENQARFSEDMHKMKEAIAGLIQVARLHDEQIDGLRQQGQDLIQTARLHSEQIDGLRQQGQEMLEQVRETRESVKQTTDNLNALIRVVDQHVSNHP